jgi:phytoene dehydrogenase-like protein
MAGLVCGAYLAREGFRVTVLEQAPKTGGFFGSFERTLRGFTDNQALIGLLA